MRIQRVDKALDSSEDARRLAIGPIDQRAIGTAPDDARVERPQEFAGGAIDRDGFVARSQAVEDAIYQDGLGLRIARSVGGVVLPGDP